MPFLSLELRNNTKAGADQAKSDLEKVSRAYDQVSQATERTSRGLQSANSSIKDATANVKQLAAQVVGLVSAYKALNAAKGFVQRGIEFSSSLEDAQTSIGSIIAATNKISTAQGKTLEGADEFNASLEISRDMMDEIQVLALESTATFDQLVQGVSGIIAPATKAGVGLEKMPKFTVTAAQAMSTMKIPLEQMRTEIEALLSGNINKAQDILATNLGITGEMVRNWKEQGILVEELMKRLEPFALAGERVANSWSGLKSNMKDALDYLGKVTGEGLFESLKQSYRELLDLIISTETGKPGISAEFENVASLMRDIQDAIGDGILDLTRDLIEELKELNKPENIAEIKESFSEFKDVTVELFGAVKEVAGAVTSFVATSMQGWSNMPDIIQEMGIVGAVLLGKKGRLALLAVGQMDNFVRGLMATVSGEMSFGDFASLPGGEEGRKILDDLEKRRAATKAPAMAVSHGGNEVSPSAASSKPASSAYKVSPTISDSGKKASASVDNARQKIAELRREIEQMRGSSTKTVSDLAKKFDDIAKSGKAAGLSAEQVRSLQQEYRDAFQAKTLEDFNKELLQAQGNTTALKNIQIAETLRGWTQQFQAAGMTAEQYAPKIAQLKTALETQQSYKDLQTAADFYKELGDLSGEYGESLEYQNRLIEQQAQLWLQTGIPLADVERRVALMRIELARDPWSGISRSATEYFAQSTNWAASFGQLYTSTMDGMVDSTWNWVNGSKNAFADVKNAFVQMMWKIAMTASMSAIGKGLTSFIGGFFGGSSGGGGGLEAIAGGSAGWGTFAHGGLAMPAGLPASGGLLTAPTFFHDGMGRAYARGGLSVAGEAGPEVFMPAKRMSDGNYGVRVAMPQESGRVVVNNTVHNYSSAVVEQEEKPNASGGIDMVTIIRQAKDAFAKDLRDRGGKSNGVMRRSYGMDTRPVRRGD